PSSATMFNYHPQNHSGTRIIPPQHSSSRFNAHRPIVDSKGSGHPTSAGCELASRGLFLLLSRSHSFLMIEFSALSWPLKRLDPSVERWAEAVMNRCGGAADDVSPS